MTMIRDVGIQAFAVESCSSRGSGSGFCETIVIGVRLSGRRASLSEVPVMCAVAVSILKVDGAAVSGVGVPMRRGLTTGVSENGVSALRDGAIGASDM